MAIDKYALTNLANALTYLGLPEGEQDSYIESIINRASSIIESALDRKLKIRLYVKERYDGKGQDILYLRQYPLIAITLDDLVWDSTNQKVTRNDGGSFVTDGFIVGDKVLVQNSNKNSGLLTITASGVLPTFLKFYEAVVEDTDDDNVTISHFRGLWINDDEIDGDDYLINQDNIYYTGGFPKGHQNIRVTYYAGYIAIPDDIEECCLRLVKKIYDKDRDVKSESLGPHSITYFEDGDIKESIRKELSTYISWVV